MDESWSVPSESIFESVLKIKRWFDVDFGIGTRVMAETISEDVYLYLFSNTDRVNVSTAISVIRKFARLAGISLVIPSQQEEEIEEMRQFERELEVLLRQKTTVRKTLRPTLREYYGINWELASAFSQLGVLNSTVFITTAKDVRVVLQIAQSVRDHTHTVMPGV